jgi:hypothetical protein
MLDNDTCEEECRVKECDYDNGRCSTCSPGCADSVKGTCKPECLTALCNWDTYSDSKSCEDTRLISFYRNVQSVYEDWNLIDIENKCEKTGCDFASDIRTIINSCNNKECGYSFGYKYQQRCSPRCTTCYGTSNGQCMSCAEGFVQLYNFCLTSCPRNYNNINSVCIHSDDTTEVNPFNSYISQGSNDLVLELIQTNNKYQILHISRGTHLIQSLNSRPIETDLSYIDKVSPLYKPGFDISQIVISAWVCDPDGISDPSLCYSDSVDPQDRPILQWTSWVELKPRKGTRLVISNLIINGKYPLISTTISMYEDYCPFTAESGTDVIDQRKKVYKGDLIPSSKDCAKYHDLSLLQVDSSTLKLENVKISHFRMEPHAIISAKGQSTVELNYVDFEYIRVSPISGSAVIVFDECPEEYLPYDCGELSYSNGKILALNDGYEIESGVVLQGFVFADGAKLINLAYLDI